MSPPVVTILSRPVVRRSLLILAFLSVFACLFYLRMLPAIGHRVDFVLDSAFHYRMTYTLLTTGAIPRLDSLSTYPDGKDVGALLPSGLYHACAAFHRLVNLLTTAPLTQTVLLFCSFWGAFIALPVYLISLELYHHRIIGLISASLAGLIPAYLNRTLCYWYRYEVLAVPILFLGFLFFLRLFRRSSRTALLLNAGLTTALLIASLLVWRLSVLFVIAYVACLLYVLLRSANDFRSVIVGCCVLVCVGAIVFLCVPGFGGRTGQFSYGSFPRAVLEIALDKVGIGAPFSDFTRLVSDNQELQEVGLRDMFSWQRLSLSAAFIGLFFLLYLYSKERSAQRDIVFVCLVIFTGLFLFILRNVVLLAPFVGIAAGEPIAYALKEKRRGGISYTLLAGVLLISTATAWDGYRMATTRGTRLEASLSEALVKINALTPHGSVVSCYWADGYVIQTYCGRPTLTDGLFESAEIVKRILEESKAYYSQDEDELWNYCTRYGATHLLVPVRRTESYADQAGLPYRDYFTREGPTALGRRTILARLLHDPGSVKRFREIFRNREYVLYEVLRG